jgi:hypothetical protein
MDEGMDAVMDELLDDVLDKVLDEAAWLQQWMERHGDSVVDTPAAIRDTGVVWPLPILDYGVESRLPSAIDRVRTQVIAVHLHLPSLAAMGSIARMQYRRRSLEIAFIVSTSLDVCSEVARCHDPGVSIQRRIKYTLQMMCPSRARINWTLLG